VSDIDFFEQMPIRFEFFDHDVVRVGIELAIAGIVFLEMHIAPFIDRAEGFDSIFKAGIEVIDAMVRRGVNDARARIFGDERIDDDCRQTIIKRMMDGDVFHLLTFKAL